MSVLGIPFELPKIWKTVILVALLLVASGGALLYTVPVQAQGQGQSTSGVTPSVTIYLSPEAFSGAGEEVEATFTFNTVVTGFDLSDISVSGGSKPTSALTPSQGGAVYTGTFTTTGDAGDLTLTVAANSASNSDGHLGPTAEVSATAQRDTHALKVKSFTSVAGSFSFAQTRFQNSIVFSEKVTEFGPEDLVITNGAMEGFFEEKRDLKFNFYVRVNGQGDMLATLKANSVKDADGMWGPPSPVTLRVPMRAPEPKAVISGVPAFIRDTTPFTASIAFSLMVTDFTVQDIRAANATLDHFAEEAAGKRWTVEVKPDGTGDVTLTIGKSSVMGARANRGPAYAVAARAIWDDAPPEVEGITFVPVGIVNKWDRIKIIVAFDEPVRGFGMEDIAVTGAIKHPALQEEADGALYTGLLNHTGGDDGVTVTVAASSVTDRAGNVGPVDPFSSTAASMDVTVTDYDADDDYLIEISTLAQLNVLRYDRDGDGDVLGNDHKAYDLAFPNGAPNMGCPGPCRGYELTADLDFDTNSSAAADGGDAYWNGGKGWKPIGKERQWKSRYLWDIDKEHAYNAIFEGNDHAISNLYMKEEQHRQAGLGLFRTLGADAEVRNLRLENVNITGGQYIGALSGSSEGYVHHVSSSGRIEAHHVRAGGLIGSLRPGGLLAHSHSSAAIHGGRHFTGGLVGNVFKGSVQYSYATGDVSGVYAVGGLVGALETAVPADTCEQSPPAASPVYSGAGEPGSIVGSYATGRVSAVAEAGGLVGINFYSNITDSYATGDVAGRDFDPFYGEHVDDHGTGGLVGGNAGSITNSYATGRLTPKPGGPSGAGGPHRFRDGVYGGLVGKNYSSGSGHFRTVTFVDGSPSQRIDTFGGTAAGSYWDAQTSGFTASAAGVGMTTAELQGPTSAAGIYAGWDASVWDFGTSGEYPDLRGSGRTAALLPEAERNTGCPELSEPAKPDTPSRLARSVPENSPEGTLVGAPATASVPAGAAATYSLNGADADNFAIDSATGQIKVGANPDLDYEDDAKNSFTVAVTADISDGTAIALVVVISVTDVNEAPAFAGGSVALSVVENTDAGTTIGAPVTATDPDGDALTYALGTTDDDGHFGIDSATGQLATKGALDIWSKDSYSVTVTATDPGGLSASASVTITVTAAPKPPRPDTSGMLELFVPENSPEGTIVGDPVTALVSGGGTATYRLSGPDADKFTIDTATGQIRVGANPDLDYEDDDKNFFIVRVRITTDIGMAFSSGVVIRVTGPKLSRTVPENSPEGTIVGAPVTALVSGGGTAIYRLSGPDADKFTIDTATGQIRVGANPDLDYEDDAKNSFIVRVAINTSNGMTLSYSVRISVTNVNEAPAFGQETVTLTIAENQPLETIVGALPAATDPDGDALTYELRGKADSYDYLVFDVDVSTGSPRLKTEAPIDYESSGSDRAYNFDLRVKDPALLEDSLKVIVNVTDVNEAPTFSDASVALSVAENTAAGTAIGAPIAARDEDGDTLTYSLGTTGDDGHFAIDSATSQLSTRGALDYESDASYSVTVTATDPDGLSASAAVTITVTDVAEAPAAFAAGMASRSVPENSPAGTKVGLPVTTTDGDGDALTYNLLGAGVDSFAIDSATGQITVKAGTELDHETKDTYVVRVTATDGSSQSYVDVTISVTDVFVDYDRDDDRLIDVDSLHQLNAIRWDLNGDGRPDKRRAVDDYERVFPEGSPDMGCPSTCQGYELTADLNFDTNDDAMVADDDGTYPNWTPIGGSANEPFTAVFDGAGHTISMLRIKHTGGNVGLFGVISRGSVIRNVGLEHVDITLPRTISAHWTATGALVGLIYMDGRVERSYSEGFVEGVIAVGGLVGNMMGGTIEDSYALTAVGANDYAGGIVGLTRSGDKGAIVRRVYSTKIASVEDMTIGGELSKAGVAGGIVGHSHTPLKGGSTIGYYASYTLVESSAGSQVERSELTTPTSASGIYAGWDENVWDFGTSSQLPALKYDTDGDGRATAAEFGSQRPAAPSRTSRAAIEPVSDLQAVLQDDGSALLTWSAPSDTDGETSYRVRRRAEGADFKLVARMVVDSDGDGVLEYRDDDGALGHEYSVRPFDNEGRQLSKWSDPAAAVPPNRAPAFADASVALSVAENTAAGTNIGGPVIATDPDGDALVYSLGATSDDDHFAIDAATGQLSTQGALDYEGQNSYSVTVTATDPDALSASVSVTIAVTDVAETIRPENVKAEAQPDGSVLLTWGAVSAAGSDGFYKVRRRVDSDDGTYAIVAQRVENGAVEYRDGSENVTSGQTYLYSVRAFDASGAKVGKWSEAVRVAIPVPNQSPGFVDASVALSVAENTAAGTNIGDPIAATDPDGDALVYSLGATSDDAHFAIDAPTGQLSTQGALDYEGQNSYSVTVTATDPDGLSASATVTITVTDVVDTPPGQPAPPTFTNIAETSFRILWSAPTPGSSPVEAVGLQYKLSADSDDAWADVKPAPGTGRRGFNLTNRGGQHVTAGASYDVRVRERNAQGWGPWSEAGTVTTAGTAQVQPAQPAAPAFTEVQETRFRILWQAPAPGASPITGYGLQYKLSSASDEAWADVKPEPRGVRASGFNLTNRSGQSITPGTSYDVRVRAKNDAGWGEWSDAGTVTTTGTPPPPKNGPPAFAADSALSLNVAENTAAGTNIGDPIASTDPDGDALVYSLGPASDAAHFAIDAATGQLSTQGALDYEGRNSYSVTVTATDPDGLSASVTVTITVTDVADTPPGKPAAPTFSDVQETRFRVVWTAPAAGSSAITGYGIQYKLSSEPGDAYADVSPTPRGTTRGYNVVARNGQDITPATSYDVRVRAKNAEGWGEWSDAGTVTTTGTAPAGS